MPTIGSSPRYVFTALTSSDVNGQCGPGGVFISNSLRMGIAANPVAAGNNVVNRVRARNKAILLDRTGVRISNCGAEGAFPHGSMGLCILMYRQGTTIVSLLRTAFRSSAVVTLYPHSISIWSMRA